MAGYTDLHNYVLGPASTPWRSTNGAPSIGGGNLLLGVDQAAERATLLVGNWYWDFDAVMTCNPGFTSSGFGVGVDPGATFIGAPYHYRFPGLRIDALAGDSDLWGVAVSGLAESAFGNFNGLAIPHSATQNLHFRFLCQVTQNRVACQITVGATTYHSGWVTWDPTTVDSFLRPALYTSQHGNPAAFDVSAGTFTFEDQVSDGDIEFLVTGAVDLLPVARHPATAAFHAASRPPFQFRPRPLMPPQFLAVPEGLPQVSTLLKSSSGKPSHARLLVGYRTPSQAQNFHEAMREQA